MPETQAMQVSLATLGPILADGEAVITVVGIAVTVVIIFGIATFAWAVGYSQRQSKPGNRKALKVFSALSIGLGVFCLGNVLFMAGVEWSVSGRKWNFSWGFLLVALIPLVAGIFGTFRARR